jgi:hypothetical protein
MKKLIRLSLAMLLVTACASNPGAQGPRETLDIRVHNDLVPPVVVTISLHPGNGIERNLGEAWSNRATDFRYNGIAPKGQYQLVARADNRAMASMPIVLDGVLALEWHLQSNRVTILKTKNDI